MARVLIVNNAQSHINVLYTVEHAVGQGCPNRREDVLLVQYLLRVAMEDGPTPGYRPPGEPPIDIDGACGQQTVAYIKFFQEEQVRRREWQVVQDNRIDPVASGTAFGAISQKLYAIVMLNLLCAERRGPKHSNLSLDPLFPRELVRALFIS